MNLDEATRCIAGALGVDRVYVLEKSGLACPGTELPLLVIRMGEQQVGITFSGKMKVVLVNIPTNVQPE